jgi:hypothetical protein
MLTCGAQKLKAKDSRTMACFAGRLMVLRGSWSVRGRTRVGSPSAAPQKCTWRGGVMDKICEARQSGVALGDYRLS